MGVVALSKIIFKQVEMMERKADTGYIRKCCVPLFTDICEVFRYSEMATKRAIVCNRFNMVLLGETGKGKTSFLRLIKNYEIQPGKNFQPSKLINYDDLSKGE